MSTSTAVVILNWNGQKFLSDFLHPLLDSLPQHCFAAVIDNDSSDQSVSWLRDNAPQVQVIENKTNLGFAGGYNEGLKHIEATYFLLLNSDVLVKPGWLEPLIQAMEENKDLAACQPLINSYHEPHYFEYAGAAGGFIDKHYYPFCRGRVYQTLEENKGQYSDYLEVAWATGACMMVRASAFWECGGFDADFFAHMEEIDLCLRMKNRAYAVACVGKSTVWHVGGGTLPTGSPFKVYLNFRNNLYLITKNHQGFLVPILFTRMVLDGLKGVESLLKGKFSDLFAILRAHKDFYLNLPTTLRKRKIEQSERRNPNRAGLYQGSLLWNIFVVKAKTVREFKPQVLDAVSA